MPAHVIATILRRIAKKYIELRAGIYKRIPGAEIPKSSVDAKKQQNDQGQKRLAEELRLHARRRKLEIASAEAALDLLYRFLEFEQVALLLDSPTRDEPVPKIGQRERSVVAEFIQNIVQADPCRIRRRKWNYDFFILNMTAVPHSIESNVVRRDLWQISSEGSGQPDSQIVES